MKREWRIGLLFVGVFLAVFYLPVGSPRFDQALFESLHLARWYAREHVVLCLIPAFLIAGYLSVFVRRAAVMRYLGAGTNPWAAYGVASVSGSVLSVCSCTVLPLFAGIYRMGAGLGPAAAFLYAGPAVNVLAILVTARVLGVELGIARAVGAIIFSVVIGLIMALIFRREEQDRSVAPASIPDDDGRPLWQTGGFLALMVAILILSNWAEAPPDTGWWRAIYEEKWFAAGLLGFLFLGILVHWGQISVTGLVIAVAAVAVAGLATRQGKVAFTAGLGAFVLLAATPDSGSRVWFEASWDLAKQILPLLLLGVLAAGALLGRPGREGLIPSAWITEWVGGNSLRANMFASVVGAFMYFATLTEVPILRGLMENGMGKGPALALLLAGPALSLPNMLIIRSVLGTAKTLVYVLLVVVMAATSGILYGAAFN